MTERVFEIRSNHPANLPQHRTSDGTTYLLVRSESLSTVFYAVDGIPGVKVAATDVYPMSSIPDLPYETRMVRRALGETFEQELVRKGQSPSQIDESKKLSWSMPGPFSNNYRR